MKCGLKVSEDSKTKAGKLIGGKCLMLSSEENLMLYYGLVVQIT